MRHTRHGWWLEEAGEVVPTRPLESDASADVVIVGGGYLGLWTAWQLLELEPSLDVLVLEADVCGHGPSGRNGGFCETLWPDAAILRDRAGDEAALAVCRASEEAVRGIGAWCEAQSVDAWYRAAPMLRVATTESQVGSWAEVVRAARELGEAEEVVALGADEIRASCDSPLFLGGARFRLNATVQPARLALGLRAKLLERGVRIHERTLVTKVHPRGWRRDPQRPGPRRLDGARGQLAGIRVPRLSPLARRRLQPHRAHRARPRGHRGAGLDGRRGDRRQPDARPLHADHDSDGRIAFGWGGGTMGFDGKVARRQELDRKVIARTRESLVRFFPQLRGRRVTHAWGGPIDVSPTHLPIFGSRGRVHHGFGFTGNGVGPSYLGGEILARLALDRRDERTRLAIVEPHRKLFPPEPFRYVGGSLIRRALLAKDAAEDEGREPGAATAFVAGLPGRLGLRLPR